jgi:predicted RNA-binding protein
MSEALIVPDKFKPPIVKRKSQGVTAFYSYDWYFNWMRGFLENVDEVFLTPCAATKPIYSSAMHRSIYRKFIAAKGYGREILVVSEPVVLIRYSDLYELENLFYYDFPPKLLDCNSRTLFIERLRSLLLGKNIIGCLPRHHASLINDAMGTDWKNYWQGDLYLMMKKANQLVF